MSLPTKESTLTNLYNERPSWLHILHVALDKEVLAAYGWTDAINVEHLHATRRGVDTPVHLDQEAPSEKKVGKSAHPPEQSTRPATATECAALQKAAETEVLRRLLELNREKSA